MKLFKEFFVRLTKPDSCEIALEAICHNKEVIDMIQSRAHRAIFFIVSNLILLFLATGCLSTLQSAEAEISKQISGEKFPNPTPTPSSSPSPTSTPTTTPTPTPSQSPRVYKIDALLFNGRGVWADEVASLRTILSSHGASFDEVSSDQLDRMSIDEISQYGMLIFPGGSGSTQAGSLNAETHARLRQAVQELGVGYIGFCAGAFIAVAPAPEPGRDVSYGLGVVDGPILDYYYLENQGKTIAMTLETFADGTQRDLVWYGGPVTPAISGGVVARYPTGDPAITQIWSGKGFVMLSAVHPAAPQRIRDYYGLSDRDGLDFNLTWRLLNATLLQKPLQTF